MQFFGRKRLDQVVVRRQFGYRDNVVVSAFAGDDEDDGVSTQQMLLAQFFQQLLAIATVFQQVSGQDDIEAVRPDLPQHLR